MLGMMTLSKAAAILGLFSSLVCTQECDVPVVPGQYTGTPFRHGLQDRFSSEITFFKVQDPTGRYLCNSTEPRADLSLLNYMSLNKSNKRHDPKTLMRAVIVVHGLNRDPWNYHAGMLEALKKAEGQDGAKNLDSIAVMTPYFPNGDDKGKGYPWNPDGQYVADRANSPALVWWASAWSAGAVNNYPPRTQTVSSFAVLDQIVQYFGDIKRFPNMKQIVVAGHSLGGQAVQRYAAVGKTRQQLGVQVPVDYWVGDPNSLVWLNATRPLTTGGCPGYDNYREGFSDYESYGADHTQPMNYNLELVARGSEAIINNFQDKAVHWGRAIRDLGDHSAGSCEGYTQGKDRNERFFAFIRQFPPSCPSADNCDTVDFVDASHDAPTLFRDISGLARLFHDNFFGRGAHAPDYGYPRQTSYDNPNPDPNRNRGPLLGADATTYAGGMKYRGCWSGMDRAQTQPTLSQMAYVGNSNSRTFCTDLCAQRRFRIAAVRLQYCYCGNSINPQAAEVPPSSCTARCPGNAGQVCGGDYRLNLFSPGPL